MPHHYSDNLVYLKREDFGFQEGFEFMSKISINLELINPNPYVENKLMHICEIRNISGLKFLNKREHLSESEDPSLCDQLLIFLSEMDDKAPYEISRIELSHNPSSSGHRFFNKNGDLLVTNKIYIIEPIYI